MEEGLHDDPRAELRALVQAAVALVEQHRDGGTSGFPKKPRARAQAASQAAVSPTPPSSFRDEPPASFRDEPPPSFQDEEDPGSGEGDEPFSPPPRAPDRPAFPPPFAPAQPEIARVRLPVAPQIPREERAAALSAVNERVRGCTACGLALTRQNTVFARGNPLSDLCFVGEGPGADEDASGVPFVGRAGQLLDKMIVAMGYSLDDVYICNIVKCRPPENRKPTPDEMATCLPYVREQIGIVSPKVIVALGATAVEGLFGQSQGGITRMRGQWKLYQAKIPVMPTFHPAYLLRTPEAKKDVWADLRAVLDKLGKRPPGKPT